MKTVQDVAKKYTKRSLLAYLEGQSGCNEKWVMGVIRASGAEDIMEALNTIPTYVNQERLSFLRRACVVA